MGNARLPAACGRWCWRRAVQGAVIDHVIRGDEEGFTHMVVLACCISVGVGAFGSVKGLCFQV